MKKLLLLLLFMPTLALCDVYRFYVIQHASEQNEAFSKLSCTELLALANGDRATIHSFAEVDTKDGNTGSFSSLHDLDYIESLNADGSIKTRAKKSTGTEFTIKESKGGVAAYTFKDTRLVRWQPLSQKADILHPITKTISATNQVSIKFNSLIATGTHTTDGLTTLYLLERTASR